ncbi:helix-turn-helix domain-containing protein [Vallicoccus soli]|uniref:helix-turn-helix domain-containing protein n=1 Tax=Vallicoccus soli TaxID=2339232 RepID=UPI0014024AD0|nr:helix-turn-helix domain-containing protein [Vallicoccus soli]
MGVLLDTRELAPGERAEALRTALREASGSTHVDLDGDGEVEGRLELRPLGPVRLFTAATTGVAMARTERAVRGASPDAVALAVHGTGTGRYEGGSSRRVVRGGDLLLVDITRPFRFSWTGRGSSASVQVATADLGMPLEAVQRAAARLPSSPLHALVRRHLLDLARSPAATAGAATEAVGGATAQLVRALLASADDRAGDRGAVLEETLVAQVRAYVRQHLRDPELGPDAVAAALSVSRRQLYRVCARHGLSLEQHVIALRLQGARDELASPAGRGRTVAAVAHAWGFRDATHFARRFRAAYGVLPRDVRDGGAGR